ncbi:MAG: TraR/DksA C4-type zinc finger protein [Gemmataceae bacterium]|nr:TraR/DksA C4-type zinc finger protein [Gemmataceae bacterium]
MAIKSRPCQRCQEMIPVERLEVLPQTRLCVKCSEQVGGDLKLKVRTRTQGKVGSLKRTGHDIEGVEWVRKPLPPEGE